MSDLKKFAEQLANLRIKEVNELATILKEEHGIEPAVASTPMMVAGDLGGKSTEATEEKSSFDVVLKSAGASRLAVVKLVKELTGLGIKEAKELVDSVPKPIKEALAKEEAESMKSKLEESGAEVELR